MKPEFSPEELRLIWRLRGRSRGDSLGWTLTLLPLAAFAVYGLWRRDLVAIFVGWAGTAAWLAWWIASASRSGRLLRNILAKYAAALEAPGRNDGGQPD